MVKGNNSLYFGTGLDNSGLRKGAFDAVGIVQGLASQVSKINPFAALAVGAATIFAGISKEAFLFARDYEKAMLEVKTISRSVAEDFSGSKKSIFKLSQEVLEDPIQLAQAYYQVVSAGYDGAEGLRLLEVASKAATAGVTDTLTAADGITTIMNAFGESVENAEQVSDALFKTVELGKTNFQQLSASISTAAPLAASLGVSYNEVLAAVASLTKQGVPTAQAMTQIRAALIGVNKELGDGFANAYTFQEAMEEVAKRANGSTQELQKSLGTIEAVGAVLATTGKNAENAAKDLEEIENAAGAAGKAFATMASGNLSSLDILGNRIRALTEDLGEGLLAAANDVAGALLDMTEAQQSFKQQSYQDEIDQLRILKIELESVGTSTERRKEIIDDLKTRYPAYLGNIRNEGELTQELTYALQDVNQQLLRRFQLAGNSEELGKTAVAIGEEEKEQRKAIIALEQELANIQSSAFRDRIAFLEQQKGRELSYLEESEEAFKLLGNQASGVALAYNRVRESGQNLIQLRKTFSDLTGDSDKLNESIVDFGKNVGNTEGIDQNLNDAGEKYVKFLEKQRKAYEAYENQIVQLGQKRADEINEQLLKQGNSYFDFLNRQLEAYKGATEQEKSIAEAAAKSGFRGLFRPDNVQKVKVEILPSVQDIELSSHAIQRLIRDLEKQVQDSGALFDSNSLTQIGNIAKRQISELNKITAIKRLKLEELSKYEEKLSQEQLQERTEAIEAQNRRLISSLNAQTDTLLREIGENVFDTVLGGTELSFQNLNSATLGQLNEIEEKIRSIQLDSQKLIDLGIDPTQVEAFTKVFETLKEDKSALVDTAQAQKIADIFGTIGSSLSQASDDFVRSLGGVVASLGTAISTFNNEQASGLEKASGLVGLIIQAGGLLREIGRNEMTEVVDAQKEINAGLFDQIALESRINDIRAERLEIESNTSAFLDSYYKADFLEALRKQGESEEELNRAMEALSQQGIFTAEATVKRLFAGTKTGTASFSIEQILGNFDAENYFDNPKSIFDPLSIFGGFADQEIQKQALANLRKNFQDTFEAMGITASEVADLTTGEWLDFFTVMEESGKITDDATSELLASAKDSLSEYQNAIESLKSTIQDFAGSIKDDLTGAIVNAFETGENAAETFGRSINDILQNLFLSDLVERQFRPYFDALQEEMEASFAPGGDQSWLDDIQDFSREIRPIMDNAVDAFQRFNEELLGVPERFRQENIDLQDSGFASVNDQKPIEEEPEDPEGLRRSVSGITQETATILAGTLNAIRVDTRAILDNSRNFAIAIENIEINTRATVNRVESSNVLLTEIRDRL